MPANRREDVVRAMRLVLQKHEREIIARAQAKEATVQLNSSGIETAYLANRKIDAELGLTEANTNLDAALIEFADTLVDVVEQIALEP